MTNKSCKKSVMALCTTLKYRTYVLRPPESDTCDTRNLLETQTQERLSSFTLRTRLNLIEGGSGGRIFLIVVVVVMVMVMALVVRVIGSNLFDGGGHLHGLQDASAVIHRDC